MDAVDHVERDVLPIGTDYPPGQVLEWHEHRRAQFLYGATGVMVVDTAAGTWTVPPERAVLIPRRHPAPGPDAGEYAEPVHSSRTPFPGGPPAARSWTCHRCFGESS